MKNPLKTGARDKFFLLDTVRHISSHHNSINKKVGPFLTPSLVTLYPFLINILKTIS